MKKLIATFCAGMMIAPTHALVIYGEPIVMPDVTVPGRAELAKTVSTADSVARGDAVRALVGYYNTAWAAKATRKFFGFTVPGVKIDAVFTFADGGTERYYINPISTDNSEPVPGSLKQGDGVAKNVPC